MQRLLVHQGTESRALSVAIANGRTCLGYVATGSACENVTAAVE
jgi:hypothetical protein